MQVGQSPRVLSQDLGPRDRVVQLRDCLLTSCSTLCSNRLYVRKPLRLQEMGGFRGRVGLTDYRVLLVHSVWSQFLSQRVVKVAYNQIVLFLNIH